jgi:hypothetical protein
MADIGTIAQAPVSACPPCSVPTVSSYTGYFPLATATFVGARPGDSANSILYYTWQRTYGYTWTAVPSPATVPVSVVVPSGMTVTSVKDMVTSTNVAYTFSAGTLIYPVTDDPIEVLLTPATPSQTITFAAIASHTYGSAPFTVTASSSLGSSYPVTFKVQSGPAQINGSAVTLTGVGTVVLQATQAGNATRAYGAANPQFSGSVTGAVLGNSFTESFSTTATSSSSPGNYAIVPAVAGTSLSNYSVNTVNGTLTVTASTTVTTTTKLSAPTTATYGALVTLTATVRSASSTPTGSVAFYNGTATLGTVKLNNGVASLKTTALPVGTDKITAAYTGSGQFSASTSPTATVFVTTASRKRNTARNTLVSQH